METITPESQPNRALTAAYIFVGLVYGTVFLGGIVWPLLYYIFGPDGFRDDYTPLAILSIVLLLMASIGMIGMYSSLRSVADKQAVELWTMVALGVAPFATYFLLNLIGYIWTWGMPRSTVYSSILTGLISSVCFSLPCVLLTLWVRRRYPREDTDV